MNSCHTTRHGLEDAIRYTGIRLSYGLEFTVSRGVRTPLPVQESTLMWLICSKLNMSLDDSHGSAAFKHNKHVRTDSTAPVDAA